MQRFWSREQKGKKAAVDWTQGKVEAEGVVARVASWRRPHLLGVWFFICLCFGKLLSKISNYIRDRVPNGEDPNWECGARARCVSV
jgi:hypothetical protein